MIDPSLNDLERQLALPGLANRLSVALLGSAEPEPARERVVELLRTVATGDVQHLQLAWNRAPGELVRVVATIAGAAPFLLPFLTRHPDWLTTLVVDDLGRERTAAEYRSRLHTTLAGLPPDEHGASLRRFKYYELARITVRDLSPDLVPRDCGGETLAELSHLADALLAAALESVAARLVASCGPAQWVDSNGKPIRLGFTVFGLGKLGSEELNYSSDVDLIYAFEHPPGDGTLTGGPLGLAPVEYFSRLAQAFGKLVNGATTDGFLYRVDLDLRPEGSRGVLVVSTHALAEYYELWAATWEKSAFMKARPVAGDLDLGWRTIRAIDAMIYRSSMDLAGVTAIKALKEKIEETKERGADAFNVKLSTGGIRDVEFVAQALQLLHGGRYREVRGRSTQRALEALAQVGLLPASDAADLLAAYHFLRRTENRIQMEGERQLHRLPSTREGLCRLARAMGFVDGDVVAAFETAMAGHRQRIHEIFARLFHHDGGEQVVTLLRRSVPQLFANPTMRPLIEDLAGRFAREIDRSADPNRAMNNLDRFIRGVGGRRFYYELLLDRPELVPRLAALFAASEYFSTYFATHPRLIEPIFRDPNVLLLSKAQLRDDLAKIRTELAAEDSRADTELEFDALRRFHNRALVNVGLLDLDDLIQPSEAERALTEIAEVCVEGGLAYAEQALQRRSGRQADPGEFLVVGMGKLASREITYGSDLDVIFLYQVPKGEESEMVEAQEYYVRLAQKLIGAMQTRTGEGTCYEIDARLRPSGGQGTLVSSLRSFARYHESSAQVWERQSLLRARPIAGADGLARAFEVLRREILRRPLPPGFGNQIHRIRLRAESELAKERALRHDFKTGRGGLQDIESVVQYLQLRYGSEHEQLFSVDRVAAHLVRLRQLGLLAEDDAEIMIVGWNFLQRLSSRLRIVQNRSISDLDEERGDLDALARQLGYPESQRAGGARRALLDDYRRHTDRIRLVYLSVFGVAT